MCRTICLDLSYKFDIIALRDLPENKRMVKKMSKPIILKVLPVILLLILCLVLGGIIIAKNAEGNYVPTIADADDSTDEQNSDTQATEETLPSENEEQDELPSESKQNDVEESPVSSVGLEFTSIGDGTCYVSGAGSCRDSFVIFPEYSPLGEKVVGIGSYSFRNCSFLKCVELNENLKFVGAYAFYGTGMVNVNISSEIEQIGDYAFGNCSDLKDITVDVGNSFYADIDGVLYNKDTSILICYPQGKEENAVSISKDVVEIKTMAFYNCNSLKMVNYEGGVSSYRRIKVGAGNENFENAVVTFVSQSENVEGILSK